MPFDVGAFVRPFINPLLKQAGNLALDLGQTIIREGWIAKTVPIEGLSATPDMRYFVATTTTALAAALQAYAAKGGHVPPETMAAGAALGLGGGKIVLPVDPNTTGDSVLVVVPGELAKIGERTLFPCGYRKVAFLRTRYQRGQRGKREPQSVWAWVA
jgi:hypothetical protein